MIFSYGSSAQRSYFRIRSLVLGCSDTEDFFSSPIFTHSLQVITRYNLT